MAGAEDVVASAAREGGCAAPLALLVLNARGLQRALSTDVAEIHTVVPVSDAFARKNQGMRSDEAAALAQVLHERAHAQGRRATITLSVAFGCPYEGDVDPARVAELARAAADGSEMIVLADTIGAATPRGVRRVIEAVHAVTDARLGLHLHNTRNAGYANALAGLEAGIDSFDAGVGGFGGCPFAPLASGNIATEDLGWILEREGVEHGLDLDALARIAERFGELLDRPVPGLFHRAGRPAAHRGV